jgi:hypothetical protein
LYLPLRGMSLKYNGNRKHNLAFPERSYGTT